MTLASVFKEQFLQKRKDFVGHAHAYSMVRARREIPEGQQCEKIYSYYIKDRQKAAPTIDNYVECVSAYVFQDGSHMLSLLFHTDTEYFGTELRTFDNRNDVFAEMCRIFPEGGPDRAEAVRSLEAAYRVYDKRQKARQQAHLDEAAAS